MAIPSALEVKEELRKLVDEKGQIKTEEAYAELAKRMNVSPEEQVEMMESGAEEIWPNRVRWARQMLMDEGFLDKDALRGIWRHTKKTNRVWIFQCNPRKYDIDNALRKTRDLSWNVTKYANEINLGDIVYLWRAGSEAGIMAIAETTSDVFESDTDDKDPDWIEKPNNEGKKNYIDLHFNKVLKTPIPKQKFLDNKILRNSLIIRAPLGTNFPVTSEEHQEIQKLLEETTDSIIEAAFKALKSLGQPSHADDIYQVIISNKFYTFNADDPVGVLTTQLERYSDNTNFTQHISSSPLFHKTAPRTYGLIEWLKDKPTNSSNVYDLIISQNQLILYGPPGTGKTFITKEIAVELLGVK